MAVKRLSDPLSTHDAVDGSGLKVLNNCLGYRVDGVDYWVERGFHTDFASIPFYARIIARWNKTDDAAVIHDKPFRDGFIYDNFGRKKYVTLWEINRVFRKIGQHSSNPEASWWKRTWWSSDSTNPAQAWLLWSGLFMGSWIAWGRRPDVRLDRVKPDPLGCE